jgi:hypothetical protein
MSEAITVGIAAHIRALGANIAINTRLQIMHWNLCSDTNVACTTCPRPISAYSSESLYGRCEDTTQWTLKARLGDLARVEGLASGSGPCLD